MSPEANSGGAAAGGGGPGATRFLRPLAIGGALAGAVIGGRALLARRHRDDGDDSGSDGSVVSGAKKKAGKAADEATDLAGEVRGAASELAVQLLDHATARLERAAP